MGLYLKGLFVAAETRMDKRYICVSVGIDAYKIKLADDVVCPADIAFGDVVTVLLRVSAFEGRVYYSGLDVQKEV